MMWLSVVLINTVSVVCLTLLAIHFDKWWIVLFSLLFGCSFTSTKKEDEHDENT